MGSCEEKGETENSPRSPYWGSQPFMTLLYKAAVTAVQLHTFQQRRPDFQCAGFIEREGWTLLAPLIGYPATAAVFLNSGSETHGLRYGQPLRGNSADRLNVKRRVVWPASHSLVRMNAVYRSTRILYQSAKHLRMRNILAKPSDCAARTTGQERRMCAKPTRCARHNIPKKNKTMLAVIQYQYNVMAKRHKIQTAL